MWDTPQLLYRAISRVILVLPVTPSELSFWRLKKKKKKKSKHSQKLLLLPENTWNRAPSGLITLPRIRWESLGTGDGMASLPWPLLCGFAVSNCWSGFTSRAFPLMVLLAFLLPSTCIFVHELNYLKKPPSSTCSSSTHHRNQPKPGCYNNHAGLCTDIWKRWCTLTKRE